MLEVGVGVPHVVRVSADVAFADVALALCEMLGRCIKRRTG